jgi:DNA primase
MRLSIEKLKELLPTARPDRRQTNLKAICPWCGGDEFGISLSENHVFGCYRKKKCGVSGNIFTLVKFLKRYDILNIEGEVGKIDKLENKIIKANIEYDLTLPNVSMPLGWKRVMQDDYLDGRGFTEYERYKVGRTFVDPRLKKHYVIIAVEEEGEIKGYVSRHVWDKKKIEQLNADYKAQGIDKVILRYINSDTDFGKVLMGYDHIVPGETKTIICVEGIFDMWNMDKLLRLHDQDQVKCNATFKCNISPEQIIKWQMKGIETLILFYDPDVIDQIKKAAAELQLYFRILVAFSESGKDPGDINEMELSEVFNNLKSPSDFIINKVNLGY